MPSDGDYLAMAYARETDPAKKAAMKPEVDRIIAEEIEANRRPKVYRKSHDVVGQLRSIRRAINELVRLTDEGEGPLEYCGWRHSVHDDVVNLADGLDRLIREAADDNPG